jgi:hypothetical protein
VAIAATGPSRLRREDELHFLVADVTGGYLASRYRCDCDIVTFRGNTRMKRITVTLFTPAVITLAVTCLLAERPATTRAVQKIPVLATRMAVAFDLSAPLAAMEQFVPDKQVAIHPAVESQPERKGPSEGPGTGLGQTPPTPPAVDASAPRAGSRSARAAEVPLTPAVVPEISATGAAVEQTTQGRRAPVEPMASFDGLGEGFTGREFPGARASGDTNGARGGAGRGGIDISLAVGPDHIFEILGAKSSTITSSNFTLASSP